MNYHNILHNDMNNGSGLRVTLFVSGCDHYCKGCQNPQTWKKDSGIEFDKAAMEEIMEELSHNYITGITFSGGDPLYQENVEYILELCKIIKKKFPTKTIWLYTGFQWEDIYKNPDTPVQDFASPFQVSRQLVLDYVDVLVDGMYLEEKADAAYPWAGSTNQRVIDVKETLQTEHIVLYHATSSEKK